MSLRWIRGGKRSHEARSSEMVITHLVSNKGAWNDYFVKFSTFSFAHFYLFWFWFLSACPSLPMSLSHLFSLQGQKQVQ